MGLTCEQRLNLLSIARDHWLDAQSTSYAYERAFNKAQQTSEVLKIGTIVSAVLTAGSPFLGFGTWLTTVTGLLTAIIAAMEKSYSPAENSKKYWECRTELDNVKRDLRTLAITLEEVKDLSTGAEPFNQAGRQIGVVSQRMAVTLSKADKNRALGDFNGSVIAAMINRLNIKLSSMSPDDEDDAVIELPEDAPGVVAAYRPRRAGVQL